MRVVIESWVSMDRDAFRARTYHVLLPAGRALALRAALRGRPEAGSLTREGGRWGLQWRWEGGADGLSRAGFPEWAAEVKAEIRRQEGVREDGGDEGQ